ncbi:hypothetical protein [Methylocella sp.]|uniref:hypothetical protein n=1 Tax=Methylocella sp. TaxID=1978226 RepID=UPI0037842D6E
MPVSNPKSWLILSVIAAYYIVATAQLHSVLPLRPLDLPRAKAMAFALEAYVSQGAADDKLTALQVFSSP